MNTLMWWYLQTAIITALLIPLVMLACRAFRHRPAVQHAFWLVVLLKFVMPILIAWPWQLSTFRPEEVKSIASEVMMPSTVMAESEVSLINSFIASACIVWCIGAVAVAIKHMIKVRTQSKIVKRGIAAPSRLVMLVHAIAQRWGINPIPVILVRNATSPFLWCIGRIRLIWPENLLTQSFPASSVIAHELAHLRRRDHWIAWLEMIATVLWWWNPLFWLVRRNIRTTAEMACDAMALKAYPEDRCEYAETLLELSAGLKSGMPALVLGVSADTPSSLERRMSMIVSERTSGKLSLPGILLTGVLALVALPGWAYGQADDKEMEAKKLAELQVQKKMAELHKKLSSLGEGEKFSQELHKLMEAAHGGDQKAAEHLTQLKLKLAETAKSAHSEDHQREMQKLHEAALQGDADAIKKVHGLMLKHEQAARHAAELGAAKQHLAKLADAAAKGDVDAAKKHEALKQKLADSTRSTTDDDRRKLEMIHKKLIEIHSQGEDMSPEVLEKLASRLLEEANKKRSDAAKEKK